MQGDNAVGAFDWSLNFRWELMDTNDMTAAHARIPLSTKDQQGNITTIVIPFTQIYFSFTHFASLRCILFSAVINITLTYL